MMLSRLLIGMMLLASEYTLAQSVTQIKIHYLHGSRPAKAYRHVEPRYFGGLYGGHYGIELTDGRVVHFRRSGRFHLVAQKRKRNGRFQLDTTQAFYGIYGGVPDSMQRTVFTVPVSVEHYERLLLAVESYCAASPYDYAFLGMRCSAATCQLLGIAGVVKPDQPRRLWWRVFRPMKLYKKLEKKAAQHAWRVEHQRGTRQRVWRPG